MIHVKHVEDQAFRVILVESACRELELQLDKPFLFGLSSILHQIEPHMEIVGYESPFFVLE